MEATPVEVTPVEVTPVEATPVEVTLVTEHVTEVQQELPLEQKEELVPVKKVKKVAPAAKKTVPKDKKLARQIKKANSLSGHATAPMTKTETITTIKDIPTSFMADSERHVHLSSGKTAILADVASRSSAVATKP